MFGLDHVFNALRSIPFWIADQGIAIINLLLKGFGALLSGAVSILPAFPDAPEMPAGIAGAFLWIVPVGEIVIALSGVVAAWAVFLGVKVVLNWARAI